MDQLFKEPTPFHTSCLLSKDDCGNRISHMVNYVNYFEILVSYAKLLFDDEVFEAVKILEIPELITPETSLIGFLHPNPHS
jgi:hypothetical protein